MPSHWLLRLPEYTDQRIVIEAAMSAIRHVRSSSPRPAWCWNMIPC